MIIVVRCFLLSMPRSWKIMRLNFMDFLIKYYG